MSKTNFYVFSNYETSLKFCGGFRFFLAVFMEKFQKIHYLNYVRRGIGELTEHKKEILIKMPIKPTEKRGNKLAITHITYRQEGFKWIFKALL